MFVFCVYVYTYDIGSLLNSLSGMVWMYFPESII